MIDSGGVFFSIKQYESELQDALRADLPSIEYRNIQRVVICADADSLSAARIIASACPHALIVLEQGPSLPDWVGHDDLVVCLSRSGNSQAVLSCLADGRRRRALCLVISGGGRLLDTARDGGIVCVRIPSELSWFSATPWFVVLVLGVFQGLGVSDAYLSLSGNLSVDERFAEYAARSLMGATPLVLSDSDDSALVEVFADTLRRVAAVPAFASTFPEAASFVDRVHLDRFTALLIRPRPSSEGVLADASRSLRAADVSVVDVPLSDRSPAMQGLHVHLLSLLVAYFVAVRYGISPADS